MHVRVRVHVAVRAFECACEYHQVALIETPDMDSAGGDKTWDSVEESWVVEHAKEVQRMMPGGLMVMGIFFFCPAEQVSVGGAKSSMAYSILRKIARFQAAVQSCEAGAEVDVGSQRLFLHMCSKTKRNSCKAFQIKDASKGGHPTELKPLPDVAAAFVRVTSRFSFNLSVPLTSKADEDAPSDTKALSSLVLAQVRQQLAGLSSLVATVDGALVSDEPLAGAGAGAGGGKSGKKGKGSGAGGSNAVEPVEVQLYNRGGEGLRARGGGGGRVDEGSGDVLQLQGDVDALAVVLSVPLADSVRVRWHALGCCLRAMLRARDAACARISLAPPRPLPSLPSLPALPSHTLPLPWPLVPRHALARAACNAATPTPPLPLSRAAAALQPLTLRVRCSGRASRRPPPPVPSLVRALAQLPALVSSCGPARARGQGGRGGGQEREGGRGTGCGRESGRRRRRSI